MSSAAKDQDQSVPAKDPEQPTTETVSTDDTSKTENDTDANTSQGKLQQTGPGPKVLGSHYRGMPSQWEKNRRPKKDEE